MGWRETLLLFAARTDASGLVEAALAQGSPASWGLAYQCLSEAQSLRPEVRARAESTLRQALHSANPAVFTPAATAIHHLRQREVRPISDKLEQRATLVTQAEYQLYLNGLGPDDRLAMLPPHWTSLHFAGAPETPILSVWPWQASGFAEWADRGASPVSWRLPAGPEPVEVPLSTAVCWRSDNTLSPLPPGVADMMDDWAKSQDLGTTQTPILADARARARDLAYAFARDLAGAHTRYFERVRARDLARANDLACALAPARDRTFDIAHALALALALALDLALALELALDRALDLNFEIARLLARSLDLDLNPDRLCPIAQDLRREILNEGDSVSRRRKQLLVCLLDVLCAGDDRLAVRKAWRDYAICLFSLARPHLSKKDRDELAPIEFALCLLRAREVGEVQPYEGIILVRDRKSS